MRASSLIPVCAVLAALALLASGCAATSSSTGTDAYNRRAAAEGSAFRFKTEKLNGADRLTLVLADDLPSGPTRADVPTRRNILRLIADTEATAGRPAPEIEDIKLLPDGRELWVIKTQGHNGVAYLVRLKASAQGGSDVEISGARGYYKD
jgi:hypothetical protein